jgi:hypothetical protein
LLQEGIEKFAKPWYRPRARRVFLDNSVPAAESDLTQAILSGLTTADHFLLLASPASAQSRWVAKEVAWWLENSDRHTLFVLLIDGEAVWDNGVLDQERTTALPEALHDIPEPRCVDLRGVRHDPRDPGWESVLAGVVAPLDGIDKSELIGHHVRERRRTKRTVVATISAVPRRASSRSGSWWSVPATATRARSPSRSSGTGRATPTAARPAPR